MIIIGISGKKGSGKDTIADFIIKNLPKKKCFKYPFAIQLYEEVAQAVFPGSKWTSSSMEEAIKFIHNHKDNFRLILQGWGTNYRRQLHGEDYWIDKWREVVMSLASTYAIIIVPDVRFVNEAEEILRLNGLMIRVERFRGEDLDKHPSECDLDDKGNLFDRVITNYESLELLEKNVIKLLNDYKQIKA